MASNKPFYLAYGTNHVHDEQYATRAEAEAAAQNVPLNVRGMGPLDRGGLVAPRWGVHEETHADGWYVDENGDYQYIAAGSDDYLY